MKSRRGAALLTALGLLMLIMVVSLDRTLLSKPARLAVANIVDRTQLEAVATAGVEDARAHLLQWLQVGAMQSLRDPSRTMDAWSAADGSVLSAQMAGEFRYHVELHDAGSRLQLNIATEDQLRKLLLALRVDGRRADRLAQTIADWRDPDQLRRANGAERDDYLRAGGAMLPDDGPFADVGVLRFVAGMNDTTYQLLAPYLTVIGSGRVDLNAAPRPVLLTLPGVSDEAVSLLLRNRQQGRRITDLSQFAEDLSPSARELFRSALPELQATTVLDTREISVVSEAARNGGSARVRVEAIISRDEEGRVIWRRVSP